MSSRQRLIGSSLLVVALALAMAPTRSVAAGEPGVIPRLLAGLSLDFGCANPANRVSHTLLPAVRAGRTTCFGKTVSLNGAGPAITSGPVGLGPQQIQSAYKLGGQDAAGRVVAIVDAYDDPKAASDLAVYRSTYGLPPCTTANGCFRKVNQTGGTLPMPSRDYGWDEEISLDLDAVSAACPTCHLLLVEAKTPDDANLAIAEDTAIRLGAVAVSNSYGHNEATTDLALDAHFTHPGVAITVSSGDSGYGVSWPASSPGVTAVGGTTLSQAGNTRGWTETAWSGSGSGCSAYEPKPAWQTDTGCSHRTVADVSADAAPASGLGVYDTSNSCGSSSLCDLFIGAGLAQGLDGWAQVGGTSLSSPLIASVYALAGNTASISGAQFVYQHTGALFDVVSGSNGTCGSYLCTSGAGYDGPTGWGTPNGTGGF